MSRPEHLNCPNTAEGIRRINEEQRRYDEDPEAYEQEERHRQEQYEQEMRERQEYSRQCEEECLEMAVSRGEISEQEAYAQMNDLPF